MANKKTNKKKNDKQPQKKSNLPLLLVAVALVVAAVLAVQLGKSPAESAKPGGEAKQVVAAGEVLSIPTADIGGDAVFFPVEVDGVSMEVLAVRASDGTVRTAFNTCQSCYTSGRGYYVQEGDELVCQNCGFHFTPEQVEIQSGGCNPWPIFSENKTVTDSEILIPYDFLKESSVIFSRWKL